MSGESRMGSGSLFLATAGFRFVIFLFFREDVLTVSCLSSSGEQLGDVRTPGSPTARAKTEEGRL
jgi:hypothetical protein